MGAKKNRGRDAGRKRAAARDATGHGPVRITAAPDSGEQFEDSRFPYDEKMSSKEYERELRALQIELLKMQRWLKATGERLAIVFEGRDGAGKGGTIARFTEHLNPRGARVVALQKPNETEVGQWYFQRYIRHLPTRGEVVFFDRSWYNRAGVEAVFGFCTVGEYLQFLQQVAPLEASICESGVRIVKFWLAVGRDEQRRRIEARREDPLKRWKLSPIDEQASARWDEYTRARDVMFFYSHKPACPWTVVRSDDKERARLNAMRHILHLLPYDEKDEAVACAPDPKIVGEPSPVTLDVSGNLFERRAGTGGGAIGARASEAVGGGFEPPGP